MPCEAGCHIRHDESNLEPLMRETFVVFKQLMIFAAVAKHRNVTRASQELHISQPGVSQQLKLLETNYGVKFFKRGGRGVELTDAGWLFLNKITPILTQVDELNRSFDSELLAPNVNSLAVGGTYSTSALVLPSLLGVFRKSHSRVGLTLRTGNRQFVESLLLASEIEIALVTGYPRSPQLIAEPYRRVRFVAVVAKNHPLARKRKMTLQELAKTPLVIRGGRNLRSTTESLLREIQKQGLRVNIVMRCEAPEAVKTAVAKRIGMGILSEDTVKAEIKKGDFKIVKLSDLKLEGESWIVYHRDKPLSPVALQFLRLLREWRDKDRRTSLATRYGKKNKASFARPALWRLPHSDETPSA